MAKGGAFERAVCKQLSLWWTGGKDDSCFWRTANSGGRATVRGRKGKKTQGHCGDICSTGKVGSTLTKVFTFELKRGYNRASFSELIDKPPHLKPSTYEQWILQASEAADRAKTPFWLIIHRRDGRRPTVVFPLTVFGYLPGKVGDQLETAKGLTARITMNNSERVYHQTELDVFLSCVSRKDVLHLHKAV